MAKSLKDAEIEFKLPFNYDFIQTENTMQVQKTQSFWFLII